MLIEAEILDALPDAFFLVEEGVIRWVSRGAGGMLQAPPGDVIGRPFRDVLAPGEAERLETLDQQRRDGWTLPEACRVRFVRISDGAAVEADVRAGALPREGVRAAVYCARDVTDAARADELVGRLADAGANPQSMLGADALLDAAEPIFRELGWTAAFTEFVDGGSVTRRALGPTGGPLAEYARSLIGRVMPLESTPVLAAVVGTGRAVFLPNVPTMLAGPERRAVPLGESMARAGMTRSAWCPVTRDGRVTHHLAVGGKDMTERDMIALRLFAAQIGAAIRMRELHDALLRRERLAAVGELAAVVAHEVRNPLAVLFNAVGGLRRLVRGPEAALDLLAVASEEAERLKRLVSDLLEFARPREPRLELADLAPIVEESAAAVLRDPTLPGVRAATFDVQVAAGLPQVQVDPARLHRALVNLLTNAFQHVPPGGRVTLSVEPEAASEVRIRVYNDGPAITPEIAPRLFDPFFTTRATGTGLGLAVVRRIIEDLGGRVGFETLASGAAFCVWLRCPATG